MVTINYPGMPQGPDIGGGLALGLQGLGELIDNKRANKAYEQYDAWLRGGQQGQPQQQSQQPMSLASLGQQGGQIQRSPLPPIQDAASARVSQAHAASGGMPPQGAIESYIRHAAQKRGIDPETAVRVAMSEGGVNDPTRQSDVVKNGVREQSYGPFQLYMGGGLGNEFQQSTGLHPSDPGAWQKGIDFALDKAKDGGWGPWYGAAKAGIGDRDGIGGAQGAVNAMAAPQGQPMAQGAPQGNPASMLPPADVMRALFKSEQTRPLAIQLAQSAQAARQGDPEAALKLEKLSLEVENLRNPQTKPNIINAGDGQLYDASTGQWMQSPSPQGGNTDVARRAESASEFGLSPDDPAYRSYVLTGKMPREDQAPLTATDKKAILEADEMVQSNDTTIQMLRSVLAPGADGGLSLNDRAGSGATANAQSWMARNDPTGLFDDSKGEATTELQNVVLGQALSSLKATFGAAPTEGERKILVDLQASTDKTPAERKLIIDRAVAAAERRLTFNQQRADELRGGNFYKPGGGTSAGKGNRTSSGIEWSVDP